MPMHGFGISAGSFVISSNQADVVLATVCGSPAVAGTFTITINSGVIVSNGGGTNAAIRTGTFPAGSVVKLVNNGSVYGRGGNGGGGSAAEQGRDAISLTFALTIDNTSGQIFGGGGGGSGGAAHGWFSGSAGGGGGGGGQGQIGGIGGAGTASSSGDGGDVDGSPGGNGNVSGPGAGGAGGSAGDANGSASGDSGSDGGTWGQPGFGLPGTGGAAGFAVRKNSNAVTWLGGNNATQVKGSVA